MYSLFFSFYQNKTIGLHLPPPIIIPYYYNTVVYSMNAAQQKIAPGTQKSRIVTKGDARVSIIDALGDLSHVSLRVQTTLNHLHDYILNVIDASPEKRKSGDNFGSSNETVMKYHWYWVVERTHL